MKKQLCAFALLLALAPSAFAQKSVVVNPLPFNSSNDDFAPVFLHNGNLLYFTSDREARGLDDGQKVFIIPRTGSGWGDAQALPEDVNGGSQTGAVAITPDGQYMVFSAYERSSGSTVGRTDLYSARKVNGRWTDIQNLGREVNSEDWDSQPALSSDGTTLLFASDRPGGFGGTDIYMSRRIGTTWGRAENLGKAINTSAEEMCPSLAADNARLYFASNRSGGQGGFDIYTLDLPSVKTTAHAVNVGSPVNSEGNEYFYYSLVNANQAYFSSDRAGGRGAIDIYSAVPDPVPGKPVLVVRGTVRDAVTNAPLGANISITDLKTSTKIADLRSDDENGSYLVMLPPGREYAVTASKKGYVFYSERFEVPDKEVGRDVTYDINLSPLSQGTTRLLVFFDFDKDELKPESRSELDRVVEFLKDNSSIKVSIEGHTDDQGTDDYNNKLSERRANSVRKYLIAEGVPATRITAKGFGKSQAAVSGNTDEVRARNRRVEMKIIQ